MLDTNWNADLNTIAIWTTSYCACTCLTLAMFTFVQTCPTMSVIWTARSSSLTPDAISIENIEWLSSDRMASSASPAANGIQDIVLSTCSTAALCLSTEPLHNALCAYLHACHLITTQLYCNKTSCSFMDVKWTSANIPWSLLFFDAGSDALFASPLLELAAGTTFFLEPAEALSGGVSSSSSAHCLTQKKRNLYVNAIPEINNDLTICFVERLDHAFAVLLDQAPYGLHALEALDPLADNDSNHTGLVSQGLLQSTSLVELQGLLDFHQCHTALALLLVARLVHSMFDIPQTVP